MTKEDWASYEAEVQKNEEAEEDNVKEDEEPKEEVIQSSSS